MILSRSAFEQLRTLGELHGLMLCNVALKLKLNLNTFKNEILLALAFASVYFDRLFDG